MKAPYREGCLISSLICNLIALYYLSPLFEDPCHSLGLVYSLKLVGYVSCIFVGLIFGGKLSFSAQMAVWTCRTKKTYMESV